MARLVESILQRENLVISQTQTALNRIRIKGHLLKRFQIAHLIQAVMCRAYLLVLLADAGFQLAKFGVINGQVTPNLTKPAANGANRFLIRFVFSV